MPLWNHPPERPRSAGGELCVISPSVANAMNVPATLVASTMTESSGTLVGPGGTADMAMKPADTQVIAIRYQVLRESV